MIAVHTAGQTHVFCFSILCNDCVERPVTPDLTYFPLHSVLQAVFVCVACSCAWHATFIKSCKRGMSWANRPDLWPAASRVCYRLKYSCFAVRSQPSKKWSETESSEELC